MPTLEKHGPMPGTRRRGCPWGDPVEKAGKAFHMRDNSINRTQRVESANRELWQLAMEKYRRQGVVGGGAGEVGKGQTVLTFMCFAKDICRKILTCH